jgi:pterin binding enzyme
VHSSGVISAPISKRPRSLRLKDGRVIRFPAVMGILNVTPDSFSDGGRFLDPDRAVDHALAMEAAVDSTRLLEALQDLPS